MGLMESIKHDLKDNPGRIAFALEEWHEDINGLYNRMPDRAPAKAHLGSLLTGIGQFKERVYKILEGYSEYCKRREHGEEESDIRGEYQG